jgi:type II secretory pathway predicted ATPase ExeA
MILRDCLVGITDSGFRFGILCGESGSGNTSFLQAGLWHHLLLNSHRCVYVKFTDLDPLLSVQQALAEQLRLPKETTENAQMLELLEAAVQSYSTPLVLLFDQFEQFFIHRTL